MILFLQSTVVIFNSVVLFRKSTICFGAWIVLFTSRVFFLTCAFIFLRFMTIDMKMCQPGIANVLELVGYRTLLGLGGEAPWIVQCSQEQEYQILLLIRSDPRLFIQDLNDIPFEIILLVVTVYYTKNIKPIPSNTISQPTPISL